MSRDRSVLKVMTPLLFFIVLEFNAGADMIEESCSSCGGVERDGEGWRWELEVVEGWKRR